jgi:hypothetical protein
VLYNTACCAEALSAAGDEAGAVHECRAGHAELDLRAICDRVEEPDEVCFMAREAWVGGGGADLRYADRSACESCEEETCGEVTVARELEERLVRFERGHFGRGVGEDRRVGCVGLVIQKK